MIVRSKLSEKDFINANFIFLWSKTFAKVIVIFIGCVLLAWFISSLILQSFTLASNPIGLFVFPLIMVGFTYFNAKKNYNSNQRISEQIEYGFYLDTLSTKGESFSATYTWDKLDKVTKSKNFIFVWHSRQLANPIPMRYFDQLQLDELKEILEKNKVKNNL